MITLSSKAIDKIKEISEEEGIGHCYIRLSILSGGCAGFSHQIEFDNKIKEVDETFDIENIKIIIDPLSFQYMENINIDYLDLPFGGGFKFSSSDIKNTCACGNSASY